MEPECSLLHLQAPATCPYPEPDQSTPSSPVLFFPLHINIIPQPTPPFTVFSLGQVSHQTTRIYIYIFFPFQCAPYGPPISTLLIPLQYLARSTSHKTNFLQHLYQILSKYVVSYENVQPEKQNTFSIFYCVRAREVIVRSKRVCHKGVLGVRKANSTEHLPHSFNSSTAGCSDYL